jgi:hypothetical protein
MSLVVVLALVLLQAPGPAAPGQAPADVVGDWDLTFSSPQGANVVKVTFKEDGDKITADLSVPLGTVQLAGAESADGLLKMTGVLKVQDMTFPLALGAKVTADTLDGLLTFGTLGEFPFTGKRPQKAEALVPTPAPGPASADSSSVTGTWNITLMIANFGAFPVSAVLEQQGEKVTGTLSTPMGALAIGGTMMGASLHLVCTADTPQGSITVTMTGELKPEGLAGKASVAGIGEADWTGVRAQ